MYYDSAQELEKGLIISEDKKSAEEVRIASLCQQH